MSHARFIVGIDLGTTNCAMGFVDTTAESPRVAPFAISQVTQPGTVEERPSLPSFMYLPADAEFAPKAFGTAWSPHNRVAVGEFARSHGAKAPMRLISSAKSWLCATGVDRTASILPWQAPAEVDKRSPVEASAAYLAHLRGAWDSTHPDAPLGQQEVYLTVPASFDAVARDLTVRAATLAGLPNVTLLEEPQAAFYAWLGDHQERWREQLSVGDVVLVCDVGGGTTDFSLIAVGQEGGSLTLERVAVGDHILLGGDNMDLALAYQVRARLEASGTTLDTWQLASLVHACRQAKEALLNDPSLPKAPMVLLGRGSKLVGGSLKTELLRDELQLLLDGFLPLVHATDAPKRAPRAGLRELGLPFASDPAITRHLAAFLGAQREQHRRATAVLFNGGVMKGAPLRQRIVETLDSWSDSPEDDLKVLEGNDLDLAVAHGAAYYGLVRRGRGVRIRGGTARAYYIGVESSMPAVPGFAPPLRAVCVAPFGMEEGTEARVPDTQLAREVGLVVGEPVEFRFLASSTRRDDAVGAVIESAERELAELAPVTATLTADGAASGQLVPVQLRSRVTEIGTLELWCEERGGDRRWKLEYNVRQDAR